MGTKKIMPYQDEIPDPLERDDITPSRVIFASSPVCFGLCCPLPSAVCDVCGLDMKSDESFGEVIPTFRYGKWYEPEPQIIGLNEAKRYARLSAPAVQGTLFSAILGRTVKFA